MGRIILIPYMKWTKTMFETTRTYLAWFWWSLELPMPSDMKSRAPWFASKKPWICSKKTKSSKSRISTPSIMVNLWSTNFLHTAFFFARFWGYFPLGMQSSECNSQVHCTLPPMPISIQSRCETTWVQNGQPTEQRLPLLYMACEFQHNLHSSPY